MISFVWRLSYQSDIVSERRSQAKHSIIVTTLYLDKYTHKAVLGPKEADLVETQAQIP